MTSWGDRAEVPVDIIMYTLLRYYLAVHLFIIKHLICTNNTLIVNDNTLMVYTIVEGSYIMPLDHLGLNCLCRQLLKLCVVCHMKKGLKTYMDSKVEAHQLHYILVRKIVSN